MGGSKGGKGSGTRKRISSKRIEGTLASWHGTWGFLEPATPIDSADASKHNGRVYVKRADLGPGSEPTVGDRFDFLVYRDGRGLGAESLRPLAADEGVDENAPLPEGWEKHWSVEQEDYYYWHSPTKATQWKRPQEEGPLPPGWSKQYDDEKGEWYYWNSVTKTPQWARPAPVEPAAKAPEAAAPVAAAPAEAPVLGQQRLQGIVTTWSGIFGWISPLQQLGPELKSLVEKNQDKIYCNWRDLEEGVKLKVGSHVSFMLYADDNGLAASEIRFYEEGDEEADEEVSMRAPANKKRARGVPTAAKKEVDFGVAEAAPAEEDLPGTLLPGWTQHWDEEHKCHFYWHAASRQASWERPAVPDDDVAEGADGIAPALGVKVWEGEGLESVEAVAATPMTPLQEQQAGRKMTPITPGAGRANGSSAGLRAAEAAGVFQGRGKVGSGSWRQQPAKFARVR